MAYEALAISIFVILVLVAIIVFIALLYSIYWINHDSDDDSEDSSIHDDCKNIDIEKSQYDLKYPFFVNNKKKKDTNFKEISIIQQLKEKSKVIPKSKCGCKKQESSVTPGVINISSEFTIDEKTPNNKLFTLGGKNKYKVSLPNNDVDGITLNFFNNSPSNKILSSNKNIMDDKESVKDKEIKSGQFMSLMYNGNFWIITNKFGGSNNTAISFDSSLQETISSKVMSIEEQLQSLLGQSN